MINLSSFGMLIAIVSCISAVAAFPTVLPFFVGHQVASSINFVRPTNLFMAKRKISMAEKRKRRQAKQQTQENSMENLPASKLDFKTKPEKTDDEPQHFKDPSAAAEKAKDLLQSQRESVDMLTMVRKRIEGLPKDDILAALEDGPGFYVHDGLLSEEATSKSLQTEARAMYDKEEMEVDTDNLGGGEYIVSIKGGTEQYTKCPRSVELVVSATKHIPEVFDTMQLDGSACMATMRGFDYKALKASMALLLGSDDEDIDSLSSSDYGTVTLDETDQRRLTFYYYLVPESWEASCGGGLIFEHGEEHIAAKYDRLVIWKSDSTLFRNDPWKGSVSNEFGSRIELHLVAEQKAKK